ncbi:MAG: hypothetical protein QOJ35_1056 [Solirubrobacteraceae bacterium]|jgi:hypothetical protein|nr:hypothetical protein [Solirubrobacteraceae bacterium]
MPRLLAAVAVLALLAPSAALAQAPQTNAPPGNSAIDQYLETVPGATGNQRPRASGTGAGNAALTPAQRTRLERLGPDGKVLADAVDATAPARTTTRKPAPETLTAQGRSPLSEVFDAAIGRDGGGGMGALLPVILLVTLLGAIAVVVARRRSVS